MNGNVPSVLSKAMGMEKKPFTYLPGGIDFSELKSPKMQKRINKHMQGGNGQTSDQSVMITYKAFKKCYRGVPHLRGFHYRGFWLMYVQVGDFCVSRGPPTVPLTQISRNTVFFKSQNPHMAGTLCT